MNYELCIMNCRDASFLESEKNLELQIFRFSDFQILRFKKIPSSVVCCLLTFYYLCSLLIYIIYNPYL